MKRVQDFSTFYMYAIIFGVAVFNILIDCKSLRMKKLKRDEKISRVIGYVYIALGLSLFIVTNFVL